MSTSRIDPIEMLRPRRKIVGMSAILLPFDDLGRIDWDGFRGHLVRTFAAGLVPAVNMDTGYVNLITPEEKRRVLVESRVLAGGKEFVAAHSSEIPPTTASILTPTGSSSTRSA